MRDDWRVIARDDKDELGEGPLWSPRHNALFWVDILSQALNRYSLSSGTVRRWSLPEKIGWVIERRDRTGFIAGLQSGFVELDLEPFAIRPIVDPEPALPGNRMNDAKADRHGRIWAGTMDAAIRETSGSLYRLDPDFSVRRVDTGYKITNGPAFCPMHNVMYHTDTGPGLVYRFELAADGELGERRVWLKFTENMGSPDGMTVDAEGFVWIAHWGGSRVSRFSPDAELERVIQLPASQITSCVFAGQNLERMFVTSAATGLDRSKEPLAGALFEVDTGGARGVAAGMFGG
jgi:D-xylonolactonase